MIQWTHTDVAATLGTWEGEKANKIKTDMIKTGTERSTKGGGGSGGSTSGNTKSDTVNTTIIIIALTLKYLNINL